LTISDFVLYNIRAILGQFKFGKRIWFFLKIIRHELGVFYSQIFTAWIQMNSAKQTKTICFCNFRPWSTNISLGQIRNQWDLRLKPYCNNSQLYFVFDSLLKVLIFDENKIVLFLRISVTPASFLINLC